MHFRLPAEFLACHCAPVEFCSRGSLYNVLTAAKASPDKMAQLGWKRRLNMALDASRGMLYLHKRGMVHTMLKSTNLLVDANWRVKVAGVWVSPPDALACSE